MIGKASPLKSEFISLIKVYLFFVLFISLNFVVNAETAKPGEVQVTSTGTGETRDSALVDACRLAVAKVHGTRILGKMANTDAAGIKGEASMKGFKNLAVTGDVKTYGVQDNTSMTFDGLLLKYDLKKEEKISNGRWSVDILATVLDTIPDRFAGKQAVVIPTAAKIESGLSSDNVSPSTIKEVAQSLHDALRDTFANHPQFVILERESEDALNEELERASSGNGAAKEQSKLKGEKVADIVAVVKGTPLKVTVNTTKFESTPPLQKVMIQERGTINLIDVSTKGEICSSAFEASNAKPVPSAGEIEPAVEKALGEFKSNLNESMRSAKVDLMGKLGIANLTCQKTGSLVVTGGLDPRLLESGDKISLWKGQGIGLTRVGEAVITVDGNDVTFDNSSLKIDRGDVLAFRIDSMKPLNKTASTSLKSPETPSTSDSSGTSPKSSLKDRIQFDN